MLIIVLWKQKSPLSVGQGKIYAKNISWELGTLHTIQNIANEIKKVLAGNETPQLNKSKFGLFEWFH